MLIVFVCCLIGFIVSFVIVSFNQTGLKIKIFHLQGLNKFSLTDRLKAIIELKLSNEICLNQFIDKDVFESLSLIEAPVFVIKGKTLNLAHLKLYEKVLENIDKKFNLILLDRRMNINNSKINVVLLEENKLSLKQIGLINSLNVNKRLRQKHSFDFNINLPNITTIQPINTHFDCKNQAYFIKTERENVINITLPNSPYPYFLKGKRGSVDILNAFNQQVMTVYGINSVKINSNSLELSMNKKSRVAITNFIREEKLKDLELLNFDIKMLDYPKIVMLKEKVIEALAQNIFLINSDVTNFKFKDLNEFLKLALLRKKYFNDYIILLKDILGISLKDGILNVKPKRYINQEFVISYKINGKNHQVKYSSAIANENKLNFVSHKLGGRDNITIGF